MNMQAKKEFEVLSDLRKYLFELESINLTAKASISQEIENQMVLLSMFFDKDEEGEKVFILPAEDSVGLVPCMEVEGGGMAKIIHWPFLTHLPAETVVRFYNDDAQVEAFQEGINRFILTRPIEITEEGDYKICYR